MKHRNSLLVILAIFVIFSVSFTFASQEEPKEETSGTLNLVTALAQPLKVSELWILSGKEFNPALDTYSVLDEGSNFRIYKDTKAAQDLGYYFDRMDTLRKEKGFRAVLPAIKVRDAGTSKGTYKLFTNKIVVRFRDDFVSEKDAERYLTTNPYFRNVSLEIKKREDGQFLVEFPLMDLLGPSMVGFWVVLRENPSLESANPLFVYSNRLHH